MTRMLAIPRSAAADGEIRSSTALIVVNTFTPTTSLGRERPQWPFRTICGVIQVADEWGSRISVVRVTIDGDATRPPPPLAECSPSGRRPGMCTYGGDMKPDDMVRALHPQSVGVAVTAVSPPAQEESTCRTPSLDTELTAERRMGAVDRRRFTRTDRRRRKPSG